MNFSLKFLLLATLVLAAYLAGRIPWEREANQASGRLVATEQDLRDSRWNTEFWQQLLLAELIDLRTSTTRWQMHQIRRNGGGYTLSYPVEDENIRPRRRRWQIEFARSPTDRQQQFNRLSVSLFGVWMTPARLKRWHADSKSFADVPATEQPWRSLILPANDSDFELLGAATPATPPDLILKALPPRTENQFAMVELQYWQSRGTQLSQVHTTTFEVHGTGDDKIEITVSSGLLKSEHEPSLRAEP